MLAAKLATSVDRDFERAVLPLIHIIWSQAITPTAMGPYDRLGADHLVWADQEPFPLVVQRKGFKVPEEELGTSQVTQCLKSIDSFRKSGGKAETYLLIHNRTGKNKELREVVGAALKSLVDSGQVKRAELWDRQRMLKEAFNAMLERVRQFIASNRSSISDQLPEYQPLTDVPLQTSELSASPYRLVTATPPVRGIHDPSYELLSKDASNLTVMIGEAGFGKTTAALRTFQSNLQVFYVPGAVFSAADVSTKGFLQQCVNLDELLVEFREEDIPTARELLSPVIAQVLKERNTPLVLIIDGLDESIFFSYRGGLQWLFNHLHHVLVPVVLLARSEFWYARLDDFTTSIGDTAEEGEKRRRKFRLIELLPWTDEQIAALAKLYRDSLTEPQQRTRVDRLIETIDDGSYVHFYGDIPSRPLFLKFILDTVAERDVHRTGRAQLYYEWVRMKIARDVINPMKWGSFGRAPLAPNVESVDMTVKLSFQAMMLAAFQMTERSNSALDLLPACSLDDVLLSHPQFGDIRDPTGLFLNSLMLPVVPSPAYEPFRIRFGHRAYQEFFLALYLQANPRVADGLTVPPSVTELLQDLANEGINSD